MQIVHLLEGPGVKDLLEGTGFQVPENGEPMHQAVAKAKHIRPIRRLTRMAAETIFRHEQTEKKDARIDVVLGAGYHQEGLASALGANLAEDLSRLQKGPQVVWIMACVEKGKLNVYLEGKQLTSEQFSDQVAGKTMVFVASVLFEAAPIFKIMRGAIHPKTQRSDPPRRRPDLVRCIFAPVVRDPAQRLTSVQIKMMHSCAPTCYTLTSLNIEKARVHSKLDSGVWRVLVPPEHAHVSSQAVEESPAEPQAPQCD